MKRNGERLELLNILIDMGIDKGIISFKEE